MWTSQTADPHLIKHFHFSSILDGQSQTWYEEDGLEYFQSRGREDRLEGVRKFMGEMIIIEN